MAQNRKILRHKISRMFFEISDRQKRPIERR